MGMETSDNPRMSPTFQIVLSQLSEVYLGY